MIKVASYAGAFERALAVLDDMEAAGVTPTAAIWGSLLVACGKVCPHPCCLACGDKDSPGIQELSVCPRQHCKDFNMQRLCGYGTPLLLEGWNPEDCAGNLRGINVVCAMALHEGSIWSPYY